MILVVLEILDFSGGTKFSMTGKTLKIESGIGLCHGGPSQPLAQTQRRLPADVITTSLTRDTDLG
jgi:hypothetical protein